MLNGQEKTEERNDRLNGIWMHLKQVVNEQKLEVRLFMVLLLLWQHNGQKILVRRIKKMDKQKFINKWTGKTYFLVGGNDKEVVLVKEEDNSTITIVRSELTFNYRKDFSKNS